MTFTLVPRILRSLKIAPISVIALFLFSNPTGLFYNPAFAPTADAQVIASSTNYQIPEDIPSSGDKTLDRLIFQAGEKYGVDPRFIHAVIWQESRYKPDAKSHVGAQGLMQLMPDTAKRFGCKNANSPEDNVDAGTHYLRWLLERFDGDVSLALAGYNAGEGAVDKYAGIPPYSETENYVKNIESRYGKTYHPILDPSEALTAFGLTQQVAQLTN
jgi:soluble lytic murein transglycosylase-like protein